MKESVGIILLSIILAGCTATIGIVITDPENGVMTDVRYESVRRVAIAVADGDVTIISGQVLINDETVQVLAQNNLQCDNPLN